MPDMSDSEPIATRLVRALPRRAATAVAGRLAASRIPAAVRAPIYRAFAQAVGADLSEVDGPLASFETFNAFFARPLVEGARVWATPQDGFGSPADGRVDAQGRVETGRMLQAKGIDYPATDFVAGTLDEDELEGARYATVYLSPRDYHRVHAPVSGTVTRVVHVGGEVWPVNGTSVPWIEGLFCQNERVALRVERGGQPPVSVVLVGATVVGRIEVRCDGAEMLGDRSRGQTRTDGAWPFDAGDELGAFLMGSTVIVVACDPDRVLEPAATSGAAIRMGEPLFARRR